MTNNKEGKESDRKPGSVLKNRVAIFEGSYLSGTTVTKRLLRLYKARNW